MTEDFCFVPGVLQAGVANAAAAAVRKARRRTIARRSRGLWGLEDNTGFYDEALQAASQARKSLEAKADFPFHVCRVSLSAGACEVKVPRVDPSM